MLLQYIPYTLSARDIFDIRSTRSTHLHLHLSVLSALGWDDLGDGLTILTKLDDAPLRDEDRRLALLPLDNPSAFIRAEVFPQRKVARAI